ncbi:3'-5' RNA helicase YTHDC2 [Drosophila busckii]|nr:3'-5' RNA helicase YTHDC2 [Drosophila busckii]
MPKRKAKKTTELSGNKPERISAHEVRALHQVVHNFIQSGALQLELTKLTNLQRREVHIYARKMGVKTRSRNNEGERVLTMTRSLFTLPNLDTQRVKFTVCPGIAQLLDRVTQEMWQQPLQSAFRRLPPNRCSPSQGMSSGLIGIRRIPPPPGRICERLAKERNELPIVHQRHRLLQLLKYSQVVIVNGATGSGKSTQLPQFLLEQATARKHAVRMVISQPRRIAAISVAARIAEERGEKLGDTVGYLIRMERKCTNRTVLTLTTSGCLLRSLAMNGAEFFSNTTHLIIDEVHDRDLDTDFLLLALKLELQRNRTLKVILMSATMDVDALSEYFNAAPVLNVEGRSFDVRTFALEQILKISGYMTPQMQAVLDNNGEDNGEVTEEQLLHAYVSTHSTAESDIDYALIVSLLELLLMSGKSGAVIVYLPGYQDMTNLQEELQIALPEAAIKILLLHSQIDVAQQRQVFNEFGDIQLKIVLSTNIGQTSITIPDLLYVIDTGRCKMKTHDAATNASQLACVWISQADAEQRAGRAGRRSNGICYRLFSSAQFNSFSRFILPEMMRRTLDEICLLAKIAAPEQPIEKFLSQALDAPQPEAVHQALKKLMVLNVIEPTTEKVTQLGHILAELPLDVQLGKCLVYGLYYRCLGSLAIITAFYSVRDPFVLPTMCSRSARNEQRRAREAYGMESYSDSLGILQLYDEYTYETERGSWYADEYCSAHHVCRRSMDMFVAAVHSLRLAMRRIFEVRDWSSISYNDKNANMVRLCMTAGLYPQLVYVDRRSSRKRVFIAAGDPAVQLARNSCLGYCFTRGRACDTSDFLLYIEKTRSNGNISHIEHLTLVSTLMVVLQCGKTAGVDLLPESEDSDATASEEEDVPCDKMVRETKFQLALDSWLRITLTQSLGLQLMQLRQHINLEFNEMINQRNVVGIRNTTADYVRLLLDLDSDASGLTATDITFRP